MAIGNNAYSQTLITAQASGPALTNTVTATSLLPAAAKYTLPAGAISYIGQKLRLRVWGQITTTTGTNNMTFSIYFGGALLYASQAIVDLASLTNSTFMLEFDLTAQTLGASANFAVSGIAYGLTAINAVTLIPATSPTTSSTFNSATANIVDFYGTWSTASASDSIQVTQYELISPN